MIIHENILGAIGNTPMIRLNKVTADFPCPVLAKVEYFNPGHSVKDRMALGMIEAAELNGQLKPGGTVIECTSGNTGMGLALACAVKGYKLICTTSDKQSKEKIDILRAVGAEVHVCPTEVAPDHPDSYYSVAERLHKETPNSVWCNQYDNLANRKAHYETTGPEIWQATEGRITHFVSAMGTTGTIMGVSRYLKEQDPTVQIVGVQPAEGASIPGIRRWPTAYLPRIFEPERVDRVIDVSQAQAEETTRALAAQEGLFAGVSSGGAVAAALRLSEELHDATLVAIICDRGDRYLSTGIFPGD